MKPIILGSVLVCAAVLSLVACSADQTPIVSAEQVDRWIEANRAKLPTDYDGLGRLPKVYRLAVFRSLPPATQSALFREQYARYALAHPDMTAAQRAVLERATVLMTPDVYALPQESPAWAERVGAPQKELERQARAAFRHDEIGRIFASIGPEDAPTP